MIHVHALRACTPTPLARYLKALGIFRLVAEQKDPSVLGWWEDECFHIATVMDEPSLQQFLLAEYAPTPVFNPWGGRSGYYAGASEGAARKALVAIERSSEPRFARFRDAITKIKARLGREKPEDAPAERRLAQHLRADLDPVALEWLDACIAVVGGEVAKPALFGTGGNEGSGSYTSGYMAAVVICLIDRAWDHALDGATFARSATPGTRWSGSFGQFLPDGIGPPWDLMLAFEGAVTMRSAISTRSRIGGSSAIDRWASSPFYVAPRASGYGSSAALDEVVMNKGKALPGRGEQWFPLWPNPSSFGEMKVLLAQGRATNRRRTAQDGYSLARAVGSLGVQRGVTEFVRYGYQQRNNVATHFAVPLGRFRVPDQPSLRTTLLDDLEGWRGRLERQARGKRASTRLRNAEHQLSESLFAVVAHPDEPLRWQRVLLTLADVEGVLKSGSGFEAGPIPRLSPGWFDAANDGSAGLRLATAFALQGSSSDEGTWDGIRRHWLPLEDHGKRFAATGDASHQRLAARPDVVMTGRNGVADAIALVERRLVEGAGRGSRHPELEPTARTGAGIADLALVVTGSLDLDRTLGLARALMAIDRRAWRARRVAPAESVTGPWPDDAWLAIRLAVLPWALDQARGVDIGADPAIVRRLAAGDGGGAFEIARRRLAARGVHCPLDGAFVDTERAGFWASALAFPISRRTARAIARRLDPASDTKGTNP